MKNAACESKRCFLFSQGWGRAFHKSAPPFLLAEKKQSSVMAAPCQLPLHRGANKMVHSLAQGKPFDTFLIEKYRVCLSVFVLAPSCGGGIGRLRGLCFVGDSVSPPLPP